MKKNSKKCKKEKQNINFTKLTHKRGVSLIVLIVTIIVIIILAAAVILTINNNNPVSSAKEATFKEDMANIQDELAMYLSKKYTDNPTSFDKSSISLSGKSMVTELPSTKKYEDKVSVIKGKLVWAGKTEDNTEYKWFTEVTDGATKQSESVRDEWKDKISEERDGVPIPKGFKYKEGTKDTGLVIQDSNGNEFVWVPANEGTYVKDTSFPGITPIGDDLPNSITDETADVKKYGGFYIGRYEAGVPENQTIIDGNTKETSNVVGIPVSKKSTIVWGNINYINAKQSAEKMISNNYVQTGLLTGTAWDMTCHFIEDYIKTLNSESTLENSVYYGNHSTSGFKYINLLKNEIEKRSNTKVKIPTGSTEYTKTKNIYDLAGNLWEWTSEKFNDSYQIIRGGTYHTVEPVAKRSSLSLSYSVENVGFRVRLYLK